MSDESDLERLKRIREQQLRSRDPHARERKRAQRVGARYEKRRRSFSDLLRHPPGSVIGTITGAVVGLAAATIFDLTVNVPVAWADAVIWWVLLLAGVLTGRIIGKVMDPSEQDDYGKW